MEHNADEKTTDLMEKVKNLPEKTWKTIQLWAGVVFALAIGFCLFYELIFSGKASATASEGSFLNIQTMIALVLAAVVPRVAERKLNRQIRHFRKILIIGLLAVIVAAVAVVLFANPPSVQ